VIELLQTLVVMGGITLWLHRGERLVRDYLVARGHGPQPAGDQVPVEPIPDDLLALSQSYADDWARQQALDHMYELYAKLKDWKSVRAALAVNAGTV
jgi:hypothetical protein